VALLRSEEGKTDRLKAGLMQDPLVTVTRGRTMDNIGNLTAEYKAAVIDPMLGTRLGQQELDAIMLEDVEGALWSSELIEADRVTAGVITDFRRVIVSVDPATTATDESDETGIVACASGEEPGHLVAPSPELHGYVLADQSGRYSPHEWGEKACLLAHELRADAIVVEDNQGGDMTETIIRDAWQRLQLERRVTGPCPAVRRVHAKVGKRLRAEPIAAIYEKHRIHHMGVFSALEAQQTSWLPGDDSPDRLDALVHGLTDLLGTAVHAVGGRKIRDRRLAGRR
jgi:phage terminase large subunit-like protein